LHWAVGAKDAKYIDGQLELLAALAVTATKIQVLETGLTVAGPPTPDHHRAERSG